MAKYKRIMKPERATQNHVIDVLLDQMQDPELDFQQAFEDYRRLGYSERWVNQRLQGIKARKELTDEWERAGVKEGQQYATLTDIITKEWSGKTTRQYKEYKGLKKESPACLPW